MIYFSIAFLLSFLIPLLTGPWRAGFFGLGVQSLILSLIVFRTSEHHGINFSLQMFELVMIRGFLVPIMMIAAIKKYKIPQDTDFIPANFIHWMGLFLLVGFGLWFGHKVFLTDTSRGIHFGSAIIGMLTAFYIFSIKSIGAGQIFALLLFENSIVLFELLGPHHNNYILQLGVMLTFVVLIFFFKKFLKELSKEVVPEDADGAEENRNSL